MKYEIVISQGCIANTFTVNGKDWSGDYEGTLMSHNERSEFLDYLFSELRKGLDDGSVLVTDLINCLALDEWKYSEPCDQCGDSVETKIWKI